MTNNKLLFIVNVDWFFLSHRLPIALEAINRGYEVHLACSFTSKIKEIEEFGITCHNLDFSRSGSSISKELCSIVSLRRLLLRVSPDIVHSVTIKPVIYTGIILKTINIQPAFVAAISGLGYVFTAKSMRAKLTKYLVSILYKCSLHGLNKTVIFQNTSDLDTLSKIVPLDESEKVLIKGSGADLSIYRYTTEPETEIKIISMACRLLKEKGVYEFIEAARLVKEKIPNTEFWLIGDIDTHNPNSVTQIEINKWHSEKTVVAFGHRNDIPELFSRSHIVALPSFYGEGVPKVLIEAAACGRPIVTTNNPGCKDAILDKKTGVLVPVRDSSKLAEAFIDLLHSKENRDAMGKNARKYAVKEFDVKHVVIKHLDIYSSLIDR